MPAIGAVRPTAIIRCTKDRRDIRPILTSAIRSRSSRSFIGSAPWLVLTSASLVPLAQAKSFSRKSPAGNGSGYQHPVKAGSGPTVRHLSLMVDLFWPAGRSSLSQGTFEPSQLVALATRVGSWPSQEAQAGSIFLFEHDLFGKPLHTFPDHALANGGGVAERRC